MVRLDQRLALVAEFCPAGRRLADVGTDHGALPVYLVQTGKVPCAVACDLRPGPLSHARANVEAAGLGEAIALRLCDGLDAVQPHEADCVVMAGMGGLLITQLLDRTAWLRDPAKTLVLQPMTDVPLVRAWLAGNGFALLAERAAQEGKRVYTVLKAAYTGCVKQQPPLFLQAGLLTQNAGAAERAFLRKERSRLEKECQGLIHTGGNPATIQEMREVIGQLTRWEEIG